MFVNLANLSVILSRKEVSRLSIFTVNFQSEVSIKCGHSIGIIPPNNKKQLREKFTFETNSSLF